jgi:hypothetical protein
MITDKDVEKLKETFATKEDLKQFATKEEMKNFKEEIIRHFDVVAEDIKSSNKLAAEQVSANTEKLAKHEKRIEKLETLKTDISLLNTRMAAVEALESKIGG